MENVTINPKNYEKQYIINLNKCFNNWGSQANYDWVFNRQVGDKTSDIILIKDEDNEVIAGSGITYRKMKNIDFGIMTGSWTLPNARGKGCFSKIIEISQEICFNKNVPFLTAFVMEDNASYKRLENAGSYLIPTSHFISNNSKTTVIKSKNIRVVDWNNELIETIYKKVKYQQNQGMCFSYNLEEFSNQYFFRVTAPKVLSIDNEFAIIEETDKIVKLLLLTRSNTDIDFSNNIETISNWSFIVKKKKLLIFSSINDITEVINNLDFKTLPSYFTVLSTDKRSSPDIFNNLDINLGDKM